ncbi:putative membrane protein YphA (DoxX/SURF4 family) [Chitinophaga terrae (ex Kim and Jung 2007)]|uniref:MauE/DoxX family redox-associated membrane protein n=1 Tax=Chitinophaga terrae (ex Kim and Jung 2007) TaxID=408074 RepID=UPI00278263F4|nr:MauE/DoxX family redox-associated membrane protein [Chitinophaga terrae (ex Kim and Jung 2007)]MDQ0107494.1 putative membrane protein YphA (DoxX/SURF4 family) [Chitinophaga terrae (ex Kim and Jung 2007)]
MLKDTILNIICLLLILLFVYTGVSKFLDFERFQLVIEQTNLLKPHAVWLKWVVPISELIIAGMLATPRTRLLGLYLSTILMLSFTLYVAGVLKFSDRLPCSCGGIINEMSWPMHLIFNIVFTILTILGIWISKFKKEKRNRNMSEVLYT